MLRKEQEARLAHALGRVCVSSFRLPKKGWDKFDDFFERNPKGVLKRSDLQPDGTLGNPEEEERGGGGHAVILIDANLSAQSFRNLSKNKANGIYGIDYMHNFLKYNFFDILNI